MNIDPFLLVILSGLLIIACLFLREAVDDDEKYLESSFLSKMCRAILSAAGIVVLVSALWAIAALTFSLT